MAQLPSELLKLVLDSLNRRELVEMTHVCSRWRALALEHNNCFRYMTLSLENGQDVANTFNAWNRSMQTTCGTAIPISLSIILASSSHNRFATPSPSMEAACSTLSGMMHLVARLSIVSLYPVLANKLMAALCRSPAPRLRRLDVAIEGIDFTWPVDIFSRSAPRLQILYTSGTSPPYMTVHAFCRITSIRMAWVSDPYTLDALPGAFPSLHELQLFRCDLSSSRSPSSLRLEQLHITEIEQSDATATFANFDTSAIPRISVAIKKDLYSVSQELLAGMDKSSLHVSIFAWDVFRPFSQRKIKEFETTIEDPIRHLRREIGSTGLDLHGIVTAFAPRLARLTIAHRLLKQLLPVAVVLPQLETLTISLRSFTVDDSVFFMRKRSYLLTAPALKLLVLHDGNGLAPDREPKGTQEVAIIAIELAALAEYMEIDRQRTVLQLCGVQLKGEEWDINPCLYLFKRDHV
ncbi:hypothetical protein BKA62DRAFT_51743 [Auriculariales sp. MPI-PUGE-AT-0066]|nr:hypothetical protein BKA62DRAFT_51743 [Auriculariales sp. MPI-PUGE-AT-0066]